MTDQFDVYANVGQNKNIPYVVVVQSKIFDASPRRVVVPLVESPPSPTPPASPRNSRWPATASSCNPWK
ncbi:CcdB family protein [Xanthomonas hortorum]|uniref:Toxin CcdB n=1 Tax=Xanthomonas hortorum pv. carotae TaxID=487904 RepID=A0A6V7FDD6_9XANT|nr:CcdB family protein [Xanthomonas hortorum]CAD0361756.1 hypothetical protein CFBP7900_36000 [Xanthomonas hortorum pv. carotae]CAD0361757.1 hypothetical protein CFBP7900_36000 [Xanthomonas hortorum pv. carotae]